MIRECQPDIVFLHPADVDWARHQYGVFNDQVKKAVESTDRYIGQIMKAVEDIGAAENTNLVLVSDHGQRNITKIVNINVALKEHGLIRVDENGEFRDWDAAVVLLRENSSPLCAASAHPIPSDEKLPPGYLLPTESSTHRSDDRSPDGFRSPARRLQPSHILPFLPP